MAGANITNTSDSNFQADVEKSDVPVLVDFWATWCGPCKAIAPHLETLAKEYEGRLKVVKVDVDHNRGTAMRFGVTGIPTLIVFKGGAQVGKHVGAAPLAGLKKLVEPHLG
jgi:thioredoxin 1